MRVVPLVALTLLLALPAAASAAPTDPYNPMVHYEPPTTQAVDLFGPGAPDPDGINPALEGDTLQAGSQTRAVEVGADIRYLRTVYTRQGILTGTYTQTAPDGTPLDAAGPVHLDGDLRIARTAAATPGTLTLHEAGATSGTSTFGTTHYTDAPAVAYLDATLAGTFVPLDPTQYTRIRFQVPQGTERVEIRIEISGQSAPVTLYDARGSPAAALPATHGAQAFATTVDATGGLWTLTLKGPIVGTFHAVVGTPETPE